MYTFNLFQSKSKIRFISHIEAYTFILHCLQKLYEKTAQPAIATCMEDIKIAIENHELSTVIVCRRLDQLTKQLQHKKEKKVIFMLIKAILDSNFKQPTHEKFFNVLGRRFESEFGTLMLTQPTPAMMTVVGRISQAIVKTIDSVIKNGNQFEIKILDRLPPSITVGRKECFGGYAKSPSFAHIKKTLLHNAPKDLDRIMLIHYKFARHVLRYLSLTLSSRKPCGEYANLVKKHYGSYRQYTKAVRQTIDETQVPIKLQNGYTARAFISNKIMSHSPLYKIEATRGRISPGYTHWTDRAGVMLSNQMSDVVGLPFKAYDWIGECYIGRANLNSRTVLDAIENEVVYVTGPSGLTSLYLGLMELLGNFETVELKQTYLASVIAYIVSTGFHSIHEIIGPAEYALKLVPGYHIQVPDVINNSLAKPANYHQYFKQLMQIDVDFAALRNQVWKNYLNYFTNIYLQKNQVTARLNVNHINKYTKSVDNTVTRANVVKI